MLVLGVKCNNCGNVTPGSQVEKLKEHAFFLGAYEALRRKHNREFPAFSNSFTVKPIDDKAVLSKCLQEFDLLLSWQGYILSDTDHEDVIREYVNGYILRKL